jgi:hypothetical protein
MFGEFILHIADWPTALVAPYYRGQIFRANLHG